MERPVEASTIIGVPSGRVGGLLLDDAAVAMPNPTSLEAAGVRHEVIVTLDDAFEGEDGVTVPVAWQAAGHPKLFPTFLGELVAAPSVGGTRLTLTGTYTIPLGLLGRFGDGFIGHRLARESLRAVLTSAAQRIADAVEADRHVV